MKRRTLSAEAVRKLMRDEIKRLGGMQSMLADRVGVSQQYVSDLLSGHRDIPTKGALLDYLGLQARITWTKK